MSKHPIKKKIPYIAFPIKIFNNNISSSFIFLNEPSNFKSYNPYQLQNVNQNRNVNQNINVNQGSLRSDIQLHTFTIGSLILNASINCSSILVQEYLKIAHDCTTNESLTKEHINSYYPLHQAIQHKCEEVVKVLIKDSFIDPLLLDSSDKTPLDYACQTLDPSII